MMDRLRERWRALNQRFTARARRERAMVILTLLVVVGLGGWQGLIAPLVDQKSSIEQRLGPLSDDIRATQKQREQLERELAQDPNAPLRERISELQNRVERYDRQINELSTALISPTEMVVLLKDMLAQYEGISLSSVTHGPAEPVDLGAEDEGGDNGGDDEGGEEAGRVDEDADSGIYTHPVTVTVTGRFRKALAYLKALEELDERLGWRSLDYQVRDWPRARIRIRLHTLSLQKEWLGV